MSASIYLSCALGVDQATAQPQQLPLDLGQIYATTQHTPGRPRWLQRPSPVSIHFHAHQFCRAEHFERFFRDLTANRLSTGVFRDMIELATPSDYVDHHLDRRSATTFWKNESRPQSLVNVQIRVTHTLARLADGVHLSESCLKGTEGSASVPQPSQRICAE